MAPPGATVVPGAAIPGWYILLEVDILFYHLLETGKHAVITLNSVAPFEHVKRMSLKGDICPSLACPCMWNPKIAPSMFEVVHNTRYCIDSYKSVNLAILCAFIDCTPFSFCISNFKQVFFVLIF